MRIFTKHREKLLLKWKETSLHDAFLTAVVIKGLNGVFEIVLGLLLIFTNFVNRIILDLIRNELIDDPDDFFATHLRSLAMQSHHSQVFGGLYLLAHGIVKGFIAAALLRNYPWAYPSAITFLGLFVLYQIIRIVQTGSITLMILTLFDVTMIWLVYREYARHKELR